MPGRIYFFIQAQKNDEQVGSLLLTKKGEQLTEVTGDSVLAKVKALVSKVRNAVSGKEETGIYKGFKYEETGVEGAEFEVYAFCSVFRTKFSPATTSFR